MQLGNIGHLEYNLENVYWKSLDKRSDTGRTINILGFSFDKEIKLAIRNYRKLVSDSGYQKKDMFMEGHKYDSSKRSLSIHQRI